MKDFEESICNECLNKLKADPFEFLSPEEKNKARKLIIKKLFTKRENIAKCKICGELFYKKVSE
jgi:tRNA U54 and U55 pseudouridine synthase Pus10